MLTTDLAVGFAAALLITGLVVGVDAALLFTDIAVGFTAALLFDDLAVGFAAALLFACYWAAGVAVVRSIRVNACWMGPRDYLYALVIFVASPVVVATVCGSSLVLWSRGE